MVHTKAGAESDKRSTVKNGLTNGGKKMSSLSSLQPMLDFSSMPSRPIANRATSTTSSNGSIRKAQDDRKRMPPPTSTLKLDTQTKSGGDASGVDAINDRKGKGKSKVEVLEILDSDEEDERPKKKEKVLAGDANEMWTDLYVPESVAELAPGKARIANVKNWLHEATYGCPPDYVGPPSGPSRLAVDRVRKYRRMLLLTGPAGTGKTTSVRLIAREMGIDIMEWGDGVEESSLGAGFERESPMSKLSSFLSRHSFAPLSLSSQHTSSQSSSSKPRLVLLTALPNISHLPTREAFHSALTSFCQSFSASSCPMIIIHSDAGSGGRAEESWMDRERGGREGALEVLGREVKEGPWCQEVDFISLAPTFVTRALTGVLAQAIPVTDRPPKSALQLIAMTSNGDLRSAINSLQLLCSRQTRSGKKRKVRDGEEGPSGSRKKISGKGSRGGKGAKLDVSDDLRAVLDAVTRREQSLNLFHALGKVFYNKRLGDPDIDSEDQEDLATIRALPPEDALPAHLKHFTREKSMNQMEVLLPSIPVDSSSFALWLHQSLPAFCSDIDQASMAVDELCSADLMRTDDDIWQSSPQAIAYALHVTARGSLLSLPSPVLRNHQKVIKPQFFQSFRSERNNSTLLDTAAGHIAKKAVAASVILSDKPIRQIVDEPAWGGVPSKLVLATELVPMMVKIQSLANKPLLPATVKPLQLPPWSTFASGLEDELKATDDMSEDMRYDDEGDDAGGGGWDIDVATAGQEDDLGILAEDDIEEW